MNENTQQAPAAGQPRWRLTKSPPVWGIATAWFLCLAMAIFGTALFFLEGNAAALFLIAAGFAIGGGLFNVTSLFLMAVLPEEPERPEKQREHTDQPEGTEEPEGQRAPGPSEAPGTAEALPIGPDTPDFPGLLDAPETHGDREMQAGKGALLFKTPRHTMRFPLESITGCQVDFSRWTRLFHIRVLYMEEGKEQTSTFFCKSPQSGLSGDAIGDLVATLEHYVPTTTSGWERHQ